MTSQEIQQYVYDFLYDKGLPHKAIVATMGNITAESDWDVTSIESGSGVGFGLCQWSYERRTQLEAYGTDIWHQCEFLWSELTGENTSTTGASLQWIATPSTVITGGTSYTFSLNDFRSANGSIEELTTAWCYCWERPAYSTNHLDTIRIPSALNFDTMSYSLSSTDSQKIESAVTWLIAIANDDTHGYDQTNRWSPDYDCSSFVISGFEQAGIPLKTNGATYTGDMKDVALNTGFTEVNWNNDTSNLLRGDILLNELHHTCVYIGNGQIVQASQNELGTATGGQTGDQTGREIYVRNYYLYPQGWDCVLRYGNGTTGGGTGGGTGGTGGVPSDDQFTDTYFTKYEKYFTEYDDLSTVYKKLITTPYILTPLSTDYINFLRTLNFNDTVQMKATFNHNKRQIGQNFLGKKLTFDNKGYTIIDVRNDGFLVITYSGSGCNNYINPRLIWQNDAEKALTKSTNVSKIKQHIKEEIEQAQEGI